jgi:hypothetical protein
MDSMEWNKYKSREVLLALNEVRALRDYEPLDTSNPDISPSLLMIRQFIDALKLKPSFQGKPVRKATPDCKASISSNVFSQSGGWSCALNSIIDCLVYNGFWRSRVIEIKDRLPTSTSRRQTRCHAKELEEDELLYEIRCYNHMKTLILLMYFKHKAPVTLKSSMEIALYHARTQGTKKVC